MHIKKQAHQVLWALQIVYRKRRYQVAAVVVGLLAAGGGSWIMHLVEYGPSSGLFWDIMPLRLIEVLTLAGSLGVLIPMQVHVLRKGKRSTTIMPGDPTRHEEREASPPRWRSFVPGQSRGLVAVLGIACLVCCVPLLFPALLGAWGSLILTLNTRLVRWSGLLFLGSLLFCGVTLLLLAHNVTAACRLPPAPGRKEELGG